LILIPVCIRGSHDMQSPYAYGDSLDPRMHTGIDLDPHGDFMFWTWRVHVVYSQNSDSSHNACENSDSMRDSRKDRRHVRNDPCTHTGSPHMQTCGDPEIFAYGESPYA
jgi:hypothetical protein